MGTVIEGPNICMGCGYGHFFQLRFRVAELADPELAKIYSKIPSLLSMTDFGKDEFNKEVENFQKENPRLEYVIDFLFLPDCDGELGRSETRDLWELIKDCKDTQIYGYLAEGKGRATFQTFKDVVKDCVDHHTKLRWY